VLELVEMVEDHEEVAMELLLLEKINRRRSKFLFINHLFYLFLHRHCFQSG
jgi:hypothetical protein